MQKNVFLTKKVVWADTFQGKKYNKLQNTGKSLFFAQKKIGLEVA
jgi:hypothetical protein